MAKLFDFLKGKEQPRGADGKFIEPINPHAPPQSAKSNGNEQLPVNVTLQQPQQQRSPRETFMGHFSNIDFFEEVDPSKMMEAATKGDAQGFADQLNTLVKNTAYITMQQMDTVVKNRVNAAVEDAVKTSTSTVHNDFALSAVTAKNPVLGADEILPQTQAVLNGFLKQGMPHQQAVDETLKHFDTIGQALGMQMGMMMPMQNKNGRPGQGGFQDRNGAGNNNDGSNNDGGDANEDWTSILTGGAQTHEDRMKEMNIHTQDNRRNNDGQNQNSGGSMNG